MFPTTPKTIDDDVLNFSRSVVPDARPEVIPVREERFAEYGYCTLNVRAKVVRDGGEAVAGWVVWLAPGAFIEAERHVVWRSPAGELIDVTPKPDGERSVVFVPEPGCSWDGNSLQPNVFRPLSASPLVAALRAGRERWEEVQVRHWNDPELVAHRRAAEERILSAALKPNPRQRAERRRKDRWRKRKRRR